MNLSIIVCVIVILFLPLIFSYCYFMIYVYEKHMMFYFFCYFIYILIVMFMISISSNSMFGFDVMYYLFEIFINKLDLSFINSWYYPVTEDSPLDMLNNIDSKLDAIKKCRLIMLEEESLLLNAKANIQQVINSTNLK